ncbi:MAG: Plug domain-containing protein, partial [Rikenellaceae bacterium]
MKKLLLQIFLFTASVASYASELSPFASDSVSYAVDAVEVTAIKQGYNLRQEPLSSTTLTAKEIQNKRVTTMKDVTSVVPNFYIPDYGSRITSSIYVRGLGAR